MADQLIQREEIFKYIDEFVAALKEEFEQEPDANDFVKSLSDDSVLSMLSPEAVAPMLREIMNMFWKEFEEKVVEFCEHWKSQVPSDDVMASWNEAEVDAFFDAFEADMETNIEKALDEVSNGRFRRNNG